MERIKLGKICEIVSGSTPKTGLAEYWDGDIDWITPAELTDETYIIEESQRKITYAAVQKTGLRSFPEGTVILSSRAPIGKVAIAGKEMYCNQGFKNLICSDKVDNRYLYWYLKGHTDYLNSLGRGATFKEISKAIVENIEIPLPDLDTQISCSVILKKCWDLISMQRVQIEAYNTLIKSRFVEMFGDPMETYSKWSVSKYGIEFGVTSGGTPATGVAEYWDEGEISWISSSLCQNVILYENDGKYITQLGLDNSSAKIFKSGTVLVALVGATIGKTALLKFDTAINQNIAAIDVNGNDAFTSEFVFYDLQFLYDKFQEIGNGKFKMANQAFIRELPLIVPPVELQKAFSDFVKKINKSKVEAQRNLENTRLLFDSLMQKYFG